MLHINLVAPAYENSRRYSRESYEPSWDPKHWAWIIPSWMFFLMVLVYLAL